MEVLLKEYSKKNKDAWEFDAYNFWIEHSGKPEERAMKDLKNPERMLKRYANYFESYEDVRIANICGSSGKRAIPLAILGSKVTVFDISEDNKKYACEVAKSAGVNIEYIVGDVLDINIHEYKDSFDVVFMEGGILHYFHNINDFMKIMNRLLKPGGKLICSDFHPLNKVLDVLKLELPVGSYFSTEVYEGEMAHARFYSKDIREQIPLCSYRKYTLSEIINSVIRSDFILRQFDEHPSWENDKVPGEFTLIANKKA